MVEKPKKKGIAIIISVGGKPPKGPADTSTPDMKKYGANPMKKSWNFLKYGGPAGMDGLDDDGNYPQGKTEPHPSLRSIDMHEYPPGSGNFMSLKDMMVHLQRMDNNMQRMDNNMSGRRGPNVGGQPAPKPNVQDIMVSPTGNLSDIPEDQRWNPL